MKTNLKWHHLMLLTGLIVFSLTSCVKDNTPDTIYLPVIVKSYEDSSYGKITMLSFTYDANNRIETISGGESGKIRLTYNSDDSVNIITTDEGTGIYTASYSNGRISGLLYNEIYNVPISYSGGVYTISGESYIFNAVHDLDVLDNYFKFKYSKESGPFQYVNMDESVKISLIYISDLFGLSYLNKKELSSIEKLTGTSDFTITNTRGDNDMIVKSDFYYNASFDHTNEYTYSEVQN